MSENTRKRIHLIYGIALSAVTVITGIRFITGCYSIYTAGKAAGGQIYTRAIIAEAFAPMALCTYLCLALVLGGFLLHLVLPPVKKKVAVEKNRELILSRLQAKTDLAVCDPQLRQQIAKQQKLRRLMVTVSAVLLSLCSALFLCYACRPDRWPEVGQVTAIVAQTAIALFGALLLPTASCVVTAYLSRSSLDKEIELMKEASKQAPATVSPAAAAGKKDLLVFVRYGILAVAVACIMIGYFNGGVADVIAKAAAICTECVGLG